MDEEEGPKILVLEIGTFGIKNDYNNIITLKIIITRNKKETPELCGWYINGKQSTEGAFRWKDIQETFHR